MATQPNINSRTNTNTHSDVKSDNGFCIIASLMNKSSDSFVQNYQALSFDAVTSTTFSQDAKVTSYSIEDGSEVSDNVTISNAQFTLSGVITETPIRAVHDMLYSGGVLNGDRISQMITYLKQVLEARKPITLVTEHKVFTNVILTNVSYSYAAEHAMIFNLTFEQVKLVKTATTNAIAVKTAPTKSVGGSVKTKVKQQPTKRTLNNSNLNSEIAAQAKNGT